MPRSVLVLMSAVSVAVAAGPAVGQGVPRRAAVRPQLPEIMPELIDDAKALAAAKLSAADGDGLREYLRLRTLTEADAARIQEVIGRLGAEDFDARQQATAEAEKLGPAAVGALRKAAVLDANNLRGADFEVAARAEAVLKRLETVPHAAVALAAVKALAQAPHPDTAAVLLKFLPVADTPPWRTPSRPPSPSGPSGTGRSIRPCSPG